MTTFTLRVDPRMYVCNMPQAHNEPLKTVTTFMLFAYPRVCTAVLCIQCKWPVTVAGIHVAGTVVTVDENCCSCG